MSDQRELFGPGVLSQWLDERREEALNSATQVGDETVMEIGLEAAIQQVFTKFRIAPIVLHEDAAESEVLDVEIDVSHDPTRALAPWTTRKVVRGTAVQFRVPFEGDEQLFDYRPNQYKLSHPVAAISAQALTIRIERTDHDAGAFENSKKAALSSITEWIGWANNDVRRYNSQMEAALRLRLEKRLAKLRGDEELAKKLGAKTGRGSPGAASVPVPMAEIVRQSVPKPAAAPQAAARHTLPGDEYEDILTVIQYLCRVMERQPASFTTLDEPALRDHILVQLNGKYGGAASAEVFNFKGKTDILLRWNGENLFIAECKFWRGAKAFLEAIDQLEDYLTCLDTKAAIVLFYRGENFSVPKVRIPGALEGRTDFLAHSQAVHPNEFRAVLRHPREAEGRLILSISLMHVPGPHEAGEEA